MEHISVLQSAADLADQAKTGPRTRSSCRRRRMICEILDKLEC